MRIPNFMRCVYLVACFMLTVNVKAEVATITKAANFSGMWKIDLRTPAERKSELECGFAVFELRQSGNKISGNHSFATPGCGRINEGGEGSVKGHALGQTAFLVVTSGRNGAIVMGRAERVGNSLRWLVLDEIKLGEPEGDSALILNRGTLLLASKKK